MDLRHVLLTDEQQQACDAVKNNQNVFLTGPAGTGKTQTLVTIINDARNKGKNVGVTALTGSAAMLIGGRTLHSFLGIGLAKRDAPSLVIKTRRNKQLFESLMLLELLIIDEASMMDADLMILVSEYLKYLRGNVLPFGGVQLVLCGDFCQLPPVSGDFCFTSSVWNTLKLKIFMLNRQIRQDGDPEFQQLLMRLRYGNCSDSDLDFLKSLKLTCFPDNIQPTRIYATNADVESINNQQLYALMKNRDLSALKTYTTQFTANGRPISNTTAIQDAQFWARSCGIPETLHLTEGAQVMLTFNIDINSKLINGRRGIVVQLDANSVLVQWVDGTRTRIEPITLKNEDFPNLAVVYVPLRLAWAITIHKSQGMTLDAVEIDLSDNIFEYGQAYTALSRARSSNSVRIIGLSRRAFRTHPQVKAFYNF